MELKQIVRPFILKQHQRDFAKVRELAAKDLHRVNGGGNRLKLSTMTCVGGSGCGDDGGDEG